MRVRKIVILGLMAFSSAKLMAKSEYVAFLGDSITTGAVTHEALSFSKPKLWDIFRGRVSVEPDLSRYQGVVGDSLTSFGTPIRLGPTVSEFFGASSWVGLHLLNAWSRVYIDTEEYSWGYILARRFGYAPGQMLFAAQDGARVAAGIRQSQRVLKFTDGVLPEKIFLFYTGNDLCGPSMDYVTSAKDFASHLNDTIEFLIKRGRIVGDAGVDIYVVGYLGIVQLIQNTSVAEKLISAREKVMTCKELLQQSTSNEVSAKGKEYLAKNPDSSLFFTMFPNSPAPWCPTLFSKNLGATPDQPQRLANRIRSYREASKLIVTKMKANLIKAQNKQIRLHYLDAGRSLNFGGDDIAEDCFHLSLQGQAKVANALQKELAAIQND